jgi:hypothetical protein
MNFLWKNSSSTAAEYLDMAAAIFFEQVLHVFKEFEVAALVRSDRNSLCIFFNSAFNDLADATVMTQVNDLCSFRLEDPAHDIDSRIVPVEQGRSGDYPDFVVRSVHILSKLYNGVKVG